MGSAPVSRRQSAPHPGARDEDVKLHLETFIPYRLAFVAREMSSSLARRYEQEFGISIPEWRVMAHLAEVRACSSGDICARTAMDKAKVNRAVTRLVAARLILAETSKSDRRLNVLVLSRRGQAVYQRIVPIALEVEATLTEALTASECKTLLQLLTKLQAGSKSNILKPVPTR